MQATNHKWARNAANCSVDRMAIARNACGLQWRGGSIGYLSPRCPSEGCPQHIFDSYVREIDRALALQRLAGMA